MISLAHLLRGLCQVTLQDRLLKIVQVAQVSNHQLALVRSVRRKLPKELLVKVISIQGSILSILPRIVDVNSGDCKIGDYNVHNLGKFS